MYKDVNSLKVEDTSSPDIDLGSRWRQSHPADATTAAFQNINSWRFRLTLSEHLFNI